jgi:hypothetical protein
MIGRGETVDNSQQWYGTVESAEPVEPLSLSLSLSVCVCVLLSDGIGIVQPFGLLEFAVRTVKSILVLLLL